jgi:nucleoside 2-deoxyribosyltransferase
MKIFVAHSSDIDFETKLYVPLRESVLNSDHEILLPQESGSKDEITREMINGCDVLVADVSRPSLGTGIEIGWADAASVPVIAIFEEGSKVSFSIDNAVTDRFEYSDAQDLINKLETTLEKLK